MIVKGKYFQPFYWGLEVAQYCSWMNWGFNLHTTIKYRYAPIGTNFVLYNPKSRGKNTSMLPNNLKNGNKINKILEGSFNRENFLEFLNEYNQKDLFKRNPFFGRNNVRFHHCDKHC